MMFFLLAALLFEESFSNGMSNWWAEGGEKAWVQFTSLGATYRF